MATPEPAIEKPSLPSSRAVSSAQSGVAGVLLNRASCGLHVTGRVENITELRHRTGKSTKGNDYAFYQQTVSLAVKGNMIDVNYTSDIDPGKPLFDFELDEYVRIEVVNPREYKGKVSFDAV